MFRRSGSVACFFVEGPAPDPHGQDFAATLGEHRFRTIEDAASEETSVGWVTSGDPSGNSFDLQDIDRDGTMWLRMRIDKKRAPTRWIQIHRDAAEKAAGRRLSARERKELKADLLGKLLPRVLPTIQLVDALYLPNESMVLLFGTSNSVREAFAGLFHRTFSCSLAPADPYRLALGLQLDGGHVDALREVAPVTWPAARDNGTARRRPAAAAARTQAAAGADVDAPDTNLETGLETGLETAVETEVDA